MHTHVEPCFKMADASESSLPCDFAEFKEALQQARVVDDSIIYKLNTSVPTKSFAGQVSAKDRCKELYEMLQVTYTSRRSAISKCVDITRDKVVSLKQQRQANPDDSKVYKQLRKAQTDLRLIENELTIEEVIEDRSMKVFKERCWQAYKPPD